MLGALLSSGLPQIDTVLDLSHSISWAAILTESISITRRTLAWLGWQTFSLTIVFSKTSFQSDYSFINNILFIHNETALYAQLCDCGLSLGESFKFTCHFTLRPAPWWVTPARVCFFLSSIVRHYVHFFPVLLDHIFINRLIEIWWNLERHSVYIVAIGLYEWLLV